jgi:uncharacterized damage-inducible protein DinB
VNGAVLRDAFGHHVWATLRLLDVCLELTPQQLATTVPGTYGSILDTARHVVGADAWYLSRMTDDPAFRVDEEQMELTEIRAVMERNGDAWTRIIEGDIDPDAVEITPQEDGSEFHTPKGIRVAQALHHGTDHRSQICTAITTLGMEPPEIDVWAYGELYGRTLEIPAPS